MRKKMIEYNQSTILHAAKELFQTKGILGTTVDEIARTADCSKATIYVYFKNKDDIYYHIVLEYMIILRDSIHTCFANAVDYEAAYFSLCNTLVQFAEDFPMYFECILGNISIEPDKMSELPVLQTIFDIGEEINGIVCTFLEKAKADDFVSSDIDPLQATFVMWSNICGWISLCSNKQAYFENSLQMNQEDMLHSGFSMILRSIKK